MSMKLNDCIIRRRVGDDNFSLVGKGVHLDKYAILPREDLEKIEADLKTEREKTEKYSDIETECRALVAIVANFDKKPRIDPLIATITVIGNKLDALGGK